MRHRISSVVILLAAIVGFAEGPDGFSGPRPSDPDGLVVHEWGTFTSVAAEDGSAVEWVPPQGPRDLPCFVDRVLFNIKGWLPATVRMETPVVYFYSNEEKTVDVRVRFRKGIITEWYPRAAVTPTAIETTTLRKPTLEGTIQWNEVRILPRASENYPVESGSTHYYAARKTDASPIEVRTDVADGGAATSQREKFLFYRGIGNFALPLAAMLGADGRVVVKSATAQPLGDVMLFENTGAASGYRALRATGQEVTLDRPATAGRDKAVRVALERMLVATGLYAKEAAAMVGTWRDSWFEDGLRLFYIVPRAAIDDVLPLEVTPAPASTARVFVGRIELITPAIVAEVKKAVLARERAPIVKYGRFLAPILARIAATSNAAETAIMQQNLSFAYATAAPTAGGCNR
jgi:hypothetical protein